MQQRAVAEPWHQPPREAAFPGQVMPTDPLFTCRNSTAAGLTTLARGKKIIVKIQKKGLQNGKYCKSPSALEEKVEQHQELQSLFCPQLLRPCCTPREGMKERSGGDALPWVSQPVTPLAPHPAPPTRAQHRGSAGLGGHPGGKPHQSSLIEL